MRRGVPCNENRFFPVRITTQGKPCSGPVMALYGIAVHYKLFYPIVHYVVHSQGTTINAEHLTFSLCTTIY